MRSRYPVRKRSEREHHDNTFSYVLMYTPYSNSVTLVFRWVHVEIEEDNVITGHNNNDRSNNKNNTQINVMNINVYA